MKDHSDLVFALLAFAFSMMAFFGNGCANVENGVLALVGICATLIVGIHVIDEFKIRQIEKKTIEMEKVAEELRKQRNNQNTIIHLSLGLACLSIQPATTLRECWKAIEMAMDNESTLNTNTCIDTTKKLIRKIENDEVLKNKVMDSKEKLPNEVTEAMVSSKLYRAFSTSLEEILKKFAQLKSKQSA